MIYMVAESPVDWAKIAERFKSCEIFDADGCNVSWGLAHSAKFPLKINYQSTSQDWTAWLYNQASEGISYDEVISAICEITGYHANEMHGDSRRSDLLDMRYLSYWICQKYLGYSLNKISRESQKDRTTVRNGLMKFEWKISHNRLLKAALLNCLEKLNEALLKKQCPELDGWTKWPEPPPQGQDVLLAIQQSVLSDVLFIRARLDGDHLIDSSGAKVEARIIGWRP